MVLGQLQVPGRPTALIAVGQGPIALAIGAGGGGLDIFTLIYPFSSSLGEWQPNYRIDRKEEVILARLRIGHTYITHSFLLKGEDWPLCIPRQEPFSVKHFLLDCTDIGIIRSRFYRVNGLKELFDTVEPVRIFSFLKEIGLYNKI